MCSPPRPRVYIIYAVLLFSVQCDLPPLRPHTAGRPRAEIRTRDRRSTVKGWDSNHSNQTVNCTHQRFIYSNNTQHNWVENFKKTAQNRVEYSNKMVHNRVKNFNKIAHNRVEYFKKRHTTGLNIPIIRHTTRVEYSHKTAHNRDKYSNKTAHNKFQ